MSKRVSNIVLYCIPCNQPFVVQGVRGPQPHEVKCPSGMHHVVIALPEGGRPVISAIGTFREPCEAPITTYPQLFWRNPALVTLLLLGVFATLITGYAALAMLVHPLLCPLAFVATVASLWLIIIALLAMNGNLEGSLIDSAFGKVTQYLSTSFASKPPSGQTGP